MFAQATYTIFEGDPEEINVCVELIGELGREITVDIDFEEDTATFEDFSNRDQTITFNNVRSITVQCLQLQTIQDDLYEDNEVFHISLSSPDNVVDVLNSNVEVTIEDSSELVIGFENSAYTVTEGATLEACVMIFSGSLAQQVSFSVNVMSSDELGTVNSECGDHPVPYTPLPPSFLPSSPSLLPFSPSLLLLSLPPPHIPLYVLWPLKLCLMKTFSLISMIAVLVCWACISSIIIMNFVLALISEVSNEEIELNSLQLCASVTIFDDEIVEDTDSFSLRLVPVTQNERVTIQQPAAVDVEDNDGKFSALHPGILDR